MPIDRRIRSLVQLLCTVDEYHAVTKFDSQDASFYPSRAGSEYWHCIPNYLVTRCPFCQLVYYAQIDTYGLRYTLHYTEIGQEISYGKVTEHETTHCSHYVANQPFIDLHGQRKVTDSDLSNNIGPIEIQTQLLPEDIESNAVVHGLPVCQIENGQFVPTFTLFILELIQAFRKVHDAS